MSVPCHEGPPATKGHFSSEPAVAGRGRYYCTRKSFLWPVQIIIYYLYLYRRECVCLCVYPSGRIHVVACGPIGTKFGTCMQMHLEMVMG